MIQIRNSIFETNSSSVHSLTMCTADEYERWCNGELYYTPYRRDKKFFTHEEAEELIREIRRKYCPNLIDDPITNEDFINNDLYLIKHYLETYARYFETFEKSYTTPGGEKIIAFGYFGDDC